MIRSTRNLIRLFVIARTLARHNALFLTELSVFVPGLAMIGRLMSRRNVPGRPGQRLARALTELGPTFIKLGQLLSTRSDLIGQTVAEDLAELQDRLPPFAAADARAIIEQELGRPIDALFSRFSEEAVAAASIAQVHFATTTEGRDVAVKVLRPGIEQAFRRDLDLFYWLAGLALRAHPALRRLKPLEVIRMFEETTRIEMDLRMEGAACSEFGENFKNDATFKVPQVDWERTGRRVLSTEWIHGIKVDELDRIRETGQDPDIVLAIASQAFFNQVFRDGFFHADLHPGNLFVLKDGRISAVDYGIMGRLDRATRFYLADMLVGFLTGDYHRIAHVHFQAGYVPPTQNIGLFTQAVRAIGQPLMNKPLNEISVGRLLAQLFAVTEQFQMETQPQLLLLQKSMLTAEGVGRLLNPKINMWELARPLIEEWMRENRGVEARMVDELEAIIVGLRRIPAVLDSVEKTATLFSADGVRLDTESMFAMARARSRQRRLEFWPIWIAILGLGALVIGFY